MQDPNKLGLVKYALTSLMESLRSDDRVGIVVYAGSDAVLLKPTKIKDRREIVRAINQLEAGGSTNGAAGIRTAYALAEEYQKKNGINRVILCTDGDFNVGVTGDALISMIEDYRSRGITLTTLGFGMGNYNDRDMEKLADKGNGNYAYIDNKREVKRVLGDKLGATLQVIAKDVKVQVQFNKDVVRDFRLVGYDNRVLRHEDFANDRIDAAEIGAGHSTTAFIEFTLHEGVRFDSTSDDRKRLVDVRVRYKAPKGHESRLIERKVATTVIKKHFEDASKRFRFGAAVVEFAEVLRKSEYAVGARFDDIKKTARNADFTRSEDGSEFVELVAQAQELWSERQRQHAMRE